MAARRAAALTLFAVALGLVWIALLTPLRSSEIAALDAEALRLAEEWQEATSASPSGNLLSGDERAQELLEQSNAAHAEARALEPPLDPLQAGGGALLAIAGGIALWPSQPSPVGTDAATARDEPAPSSA